MAAELALEVIAQLVNPQKANFPKKGTPPDEPPQRESEQPPRPSRSQPLRKSKAKQEPDEPVISRSRSPFKSKKEPKAKARPRHLPDASTVPTVPAVPEPTTAIVGRGRGRPRKNPVDSTGNQEIKGKNNARTKKIKDKEYIATTAPVMGYYDVTNDAHMMKPKKIPAHIINAI